MLLIFRKSSHSIVLVEVATLCRISARFVSSKMSSADKNILALDFDGVMCHSSPESSLSAVIACNKKWEYDMTIQEMEVTMLHDVQPEYA